jgi:hypothetical protein
MQRRDPCGWSRLALASLGLLLVPVMAVAQEKTPAQPHIEAALLHYESLEYEKALEELDRAQRRARAPEDTVSILLFEGVILAELGREEEAVAAFEAALRLQPEAVFPLVVAPKIKQQLEAAREALKAQAQTEQRPAEPGAATADASPAPGQRQAGTEPAEHAPQGESIPYELAAERGSSFSGARFTLGLVGGAGGGVVGGGFGLLMGFLVSSLVCSQGGNCVGNVILVGIPIGMAGGLSFGTYGAGKLMGGRGGYGFTILGMLAGAAVGVGIAQVTSSSVAVLSIGGGALGGAVAGYELSHAFSGSPAGAQPRSDAALSVLPGVSVTHQGGVLAGLAGRF